MPTALGGVLDRVEQVHQAEAKEQLESAFQQPLRLNQNPAPCFQRWRLAPAAQCCWEPLAEAPMGTWTTEQREVLCCNGCREDH